MQNKRGRFVIQTLEVVNGIDVQSGAIACTGALSAGGDIAIVGHADGKVFSANAFQYPAPGTDWTPTQRGALLAEGKTGSKVWVPLNFLKNGDEITAYSLAGGITKYSGNTNTIDCKISKTARGVDGTVTDITSGAIAQQTSGAFRATATITAETVTTGASGFSYNLEIAGTTGASGHAYIYAAEVTVNRKV